MNFKKLTAILLSAAMLIMPQGLSVKAVDIAENSDIPQYSVQEDKTAYQESAEIRDPAVTVVLATTQKNVTTTTTTATTTINTSPVTTVSTEVNRPLVGDWELYSETNNGKDTGRSEEKIVFNFLRNGEIRLFRDSAFFSEGKYEEIGNPDKTREDNVYGLGIKIDDNFFYGNKDEPSYNSAIFKRTINDDILTLDDMQGNMLYFRRKKFTALEGTRSKIDADWELAVFDSVTYNGFAVRITNNSDTVYDNLSARYYLDLREFIDAGLDPESIDICVTDDSNVDDPYVKVSKLTNYYESIYYFELTYPDGRDVIKSNAWIGVKFEVPTGYEDLLGKVLHTDSTWFYNVWKVESISRIYTGYDHFNDNGTILPIYLNGNLFYGYEPDGSFAFEELSRALPEGYWIGEIKGKASKESEYNILLSESITSVDKTAFTSATDSITVQNPNMGFPSGGFYYFSKGTIYGYEGSTAEEYCKKHSNYTFYPINKSPYFRSDDVVVGNDVLISPDAISVDPHSYGYKYSSVTFPDPDVPITKLFFVPKGSYKKAIIYGYEGSTAQKFAEYHGFTFKPIEESPFYKTYINPETNTTTIATTSTARQTTPTTPVTSENPTQPQTTVSTQATSAPKTTVTSERTTTTTKRTTTTASNTQTTSTSKPKITVTTTNRTLPPTTIEPWFTSAVKITSTSQETETTSTAAKTTTTTTKIMHEPLKYGDANCDGKTTVADAVAILQHIGNRDKYGLTVYGQQCADVDGIAGVTAKDALVIQQVDAGLYKIEDLPLKTK